MASSPTSSNSNAEGTPARVSYAPVDAPTENVSPGPGVLLPRTPSTGCRRGGPAPSSSTCKRRRLAPAEETGGGTAPLSLSAVDGSARRLNFRDTCDADASDGSDDEDDEGELLRGSVLRKMRRLQYEDGDDGDQLLHTAAAARLFEYVKEYDVVAKASAATSPAARAPAAKGGAEGEWKYRGSGCVKFVKCMDEGYNCGMIRAELTKTGTLHLLMRHELIHEEVVSMPSKKGRAYTWRVSDDAYCPAARTLALRFDDDMDALTWKNWAERSKAHNARVRRGLDVPDLDDVCAAFGGLTTAAVAAPASPPAAAAGGGAQ